MLSVVPGLMIVHIRTKGVRMRTVYHKHLYLLPRSIRGNTKSKTNNPYNIDIQ